MSALSNADERYPWLNHVATRLAHYQPLILITAAIVTAASVAARHSSIAATGVSYGVAVAAGFLVTTIVVIVLTAERYHLARLCTICADNTPADGAAEAQRIKYPWLWFKHSKAMVYLAAILLLAVLVVAAIGAWLHLNAPNFWTMSYYQLTGEGDWTDYLFAVLYLNWALDTYANLRHRPLIPWCPWCRRWDEGGEHETVPEPTPPSQSPTPTPVQVAS